MIHMANQQNQRVVANPKYIHLGDFLMRPGKKICYKHRDGFEVLCQKQMLGLRLDCSHCEHREIYEREMYKYTWTRWSGTSVVPDIRKMWDSFPDIEKIKMKIAKDAGVRLWDEVMRKPDAQIFVMKAFLEYMNQGTQWKKDYEPFLEKIISDYKIRTKK